MSTKEDLPDQSKYSKLIHKQLENLDLEAGVVL